jgi:hypothetical protein
VNRDREALLAAIARAGGSGVVNAAEVKQGAIDAAGRVAWIETDVARLRVAGGGRILFDRNLNRQDESNWGYEGCSVPYLEWWGDRLVAIATEERVTAVWSVGAGGDHEARPIPGRWAVDGDVVAWVSEDYPGLLCGMAIPSLESLLPLPRRFVSRRVRLTCENGKAVLSPDRNEGGEIESLRLPAAAQRSSPSGGEAFLESVFARLDPETGADESLRMLVEAAARPFCEDDTRRPVPFWMPVYWHRHLAAT